MISYLIKVINLMLGQKNSKFDFILDDLSSIVIT